MYKIREIIINPKSIKKVSPIAGWIHTRNKRMKAFKIKKDGLFLPGTWDLTKREISSFLCYKDFMLFIKRKSPHYNWKKLYASIKKEGYVQKKNNRYVEVAIGRNGDILLVDGRHRLIIAQELNIPEIPVNVIDIHPDYKFSKLNLIKNKVIPEFLYDMIAKKWNKNIKTYHHWGTINHRYNLAKKYLPFLQDLNVLEIGCNSGMMMWSIMKYAKLLIELEKQEKYYLQCKATYKSLYSFHKGQIDVNNESFKEFITNHSCKYINALYASFVLYHMNDEEIKLLKTKILPRCKVVIIPNRIKERRSQINKYHLNRDESIKKLLKDCGFKVIVDTSFQKGYSIIVGTK